MGEGSPAVIMPPTPLVPSLVPGLSAVAILQMKSAGLATVGHSRLDRVFLICTLQYQVTFALAEVTLIS